MKSTFIGANSKLGITPVRKNLEFLKGLKISALHVHSFANCTNLKDYKIYLEKVYEIKCIIEKITACYIGQINLGGGFAPAFLYQNPGQFFKGVGLLINDIFRNVNIKTTFIFEPGRFIVASAAVAVSKILALKTTGNSHYAFCNFPSSYLIPLQNSRFEVFHPDYSFSAKTRVKVVDLICSPAGYFGSNNMDIKKMEQ
jgi:diaminopimelate decarboxylase